MRTVQVLIDPRLDERKGQSERNANPIPLLIGGVLLISAGLAVAFLVLSTLYVAGSVTTASSLPALVAAVTRQSSFFGEVLISSILGSAAGLLIGALRRWRRIKSKAEETLLSALLARKLLARDPMFIPAVVISAVIGLVVASIVGIGACTEVHKLVWEGYHHAMAPMLASGSGNSPGQAPGAFAGGYWILFLVLVITLVQALVVGVALGASGYVIAGLITGAAKGASKGLFRSSVELCGAEADGLGLLAVLTKNAYRGAFEGGVVGVIVGLISGTVLIAVIDGPRIRNFLTAAFFLGWLLILLISLLGPYVSMLRDDLRRFGTVPGLQDDNRDPKTGNIIENRVPVCPFCKEPLEITEVDLRSRVLICKHCLQVVFDGSSVVWQVELGRSLGVGPGRGLRRCRGGARRW